MEPVNVVESVDAHVAESVDPASRRGRGRAAALAARAATLADAAHVEQVEAAVFPTRRDATQLVEKYALAHPRPHIGRAAPRARLALLPGGLGARHQDVDRAPRRVDDV